MHNWQGSGERDSIFRTRLPISTLSAVNRNSAGFRSSELAAGELLGSERRHSQRIDPVGREVDGLMRRQHPIPSRRQYRWHTVLA
jgi:hypothetical protein